VRLEPDGDGLKLLVQATSNPELELWAAERKADLMRRVFHRTVRVDLDDTSSSHPAADGQNAPRATPES
jgi:hypothetical protein